MAPEKKTVLVLEDDDGVARMIKTWGNLGCFSGDGASCYKTTVYKDIQKASDFLQQKYRSLIGVWTDYELGNVRNGLDFTQEVKLLDPSLPVALVSANQVEIQEAKEAGVDLFIMKPFNIDDIRTLCLTFPLIEKVLKGELKLSSLRSLLLKRGREKWLLLS